MGTSQNYIIMAIIVFAIIAILVFFIRKNKEAKQLTPLANLAFLFILMGILFGDNRFVGYGFMIAGIILAIIDMILKLKKK